MRVAAIDIGTNTVLLLVAESDGGLHAELELATITRLGESVDRTHELADAACERTLSCLVRYKQALDETQVARLDVVGTSALRDARGGGEFLARAEAVLGSAPRVISGSEEAQLTYEGALSGLDLHGDVNVFDIGGGSTEIVCGRAKPAAVLTSVSLDVGSVRLFERHVRSDPPSPAERAQIAADVRRALAGAPPALHDAELVGVAGTVTQLAALELGLGDYDPARVHGTRLHGRSLLRLTAELEQLALAERRKLPGMQPGRADVIGVGARILVEILEYAGADSLIVSDRGVRWGLAQRLTSV